VATNGGNAVMGLGHSPRIVTDGLVLCLDAANKRSYGGSGTTWTDLKGGNNATMQNMSSNDFIEDNAGYFSFDGTNQYFETSLSGIAGSNQDFTISCWAKINNISNSDNHFLISNYLGGAQTPYYSIRPNSNLSSVRFQGRYGATADVSINQGQFNLITATRDTSITKVKIFVNGDFKASATVGASSDFDGDYPIGGMKHANGRYFEADIGIVQVYNKALTADEVRQNYLATKERYA